MEDNSIAQKTNVETDNNNFDNKKQTESQNPVKQEKRKTKIWLIVGGIIIGIIIILIILLGLRRDNREDRLIIFDALKNEKIIPGNMKQIDVMSYYHWPLEWCERNDYYIYQGDNSEIIAIEYGGRRRMFSDYDNRVIVYFDVDVNDDINYINSENAECGGGHSYYRYQDGKYTDDRKYEFGTMKEYHATRESSFFKGDYYTLELAN